MKIFSSSFLAFAFLGLVACQDGNQQNQPENGVVEMDAEADIQGTQDDMTRQSLADNQTSLYDVARDNEDLTNFSQNLNTQEATQTLDRGEGPYTVFAPEDAAYDQLSDQDRNDANSNRVASLEYLVVEDEFTQQELRTEVENSSQEYTLATLQGDEITVELQGEDVVLRDAMGNEATIIASHDDAFNGIVHIIDGVLRPMTDGQQNNDQMTEGVTGVNPSQEGQATTVAVEE